MLEKHERLSTFREVQLRLKVSERTLRRWISEGQIGCIYVGRFIRFEETEIKRFLDAKRRLAKKKTA